MVRERFSLRDMGTLVKGLVVEGKTGPVVLPEIDQVQADYWQSDYLSGFKFDWLGVEVDQRPLLVAALEHLGASFVQSFLNILPYSSFERKKGDVGMMLVIERKREQSQAYNFTPQEEFDPNWSQHRSLPKGAVLKVLIKPVEEPERLFNQGFLVRFLSI